MVLVREADGFQIGVEAKLKLNTLVVSQALKGHCYTPQQPGPDCRAILVPALEEGPPGLRHICERLGITVITVSRDQAYRYRKPEDAPFSFHPHLPEAEVTWYDSDWFELAPDQRIALPEYTSDGKAGTPSPVKLTSWKIKALKICALIETFGYVTRADFKFLQIDVRLWIDSRWLRKRDDGGLVGVPGMPRFWRQHPTAYAEIKADMERWNNREKGTST